MANTLDVYRDWLNIPDSEQRPLNHYQLLRLPKFEDDTAKIRKHYRKLNAHVRKYSSGKYAKESQNLLNELAKSMLCLTDAKRKKDYDEQMGRKDGKSVRLRTLEELLVNRHLIESPKLKRAQHLARAVGIELHEALIQQKALDPSRIAQNYAESLGLSYIDLGDLELTERVLKKVPAFLARQHSCVPVLVDEGQLVLASPKVLRPEVEDQFRIKAGMPVRLAICTRQNVDDVIEDHYTKEQAQKEMGLKTSMMRAIPADGEGDAEGSAKDTLTPQQRREAFKRRAQVAFVAFAVTTFVCIVVLNLPFEYGAMGYAMGVGAGIGLGVLAFGLMTVLKL
ncbi:General secretion pathway protein GspE [Planctomycetales bacterium 10988]|nr:General secretion pathway protein GspE [Planctomycetales bacterium 10988]